MSGQFLVAAWQTSALTTAVLDVSTATAEFAINWLLQSTLLISIGLLAGVLIRKRGSAAQSVVYRTTLVAALLCPLATWILAQSGLSGWSLEFPPAWALIAPDNAEPTANAPLVAIRPEQAQKTLTVNRAERDAPIVIPSPPATAMAPRIMADQREQPLPPPPTAATEISADTKLVATVIPPEAKAMRLEIRALGLLAVGIVMVWFVVSAALLAKIGFAWFELSRLRRRTILAEATTIETCQRLATQLGVRSPLVLRSPYIQSPCLAGLRRPAVLLPEEQIELPIRDVLIHELAHLRRHDCHWKLLHKLTSAVFFFQPLLWKLARRIDATSEEVCDDHVMQLGGDRQQYAHGLVDVAELSAAPAAAVGAVGVGIVSLRSMLAHRVARIMDTRRPLSTRVGSMLFGLVLLGGLIGTGVVGLVGLKPRQSLAEAPPTADRVTNETEIETVEPEATIGFTPVDDSDAEPAEATATEHKAAAQAKELFGRVLGANGKPVAGAEFYWFRTRVHDIDPMTPRLIAKTNEKGEFKFTPPSVVATDDEPAGWAFREQIVVKAPGHGCKVTSPQELGGRKPESVIELAAGAIVRLPAAGEPIQGRLVNIDGQPIAGAKVRTRWFNDADDARRFQTALAAADKPRLWNERVNNLLNVIEPAPLRDVLPQTVTDADGRFALADIGANRLVQLLVEGAGVETTEIVAHNESAEEIHIPADKQGDRREKTVYGRQFVRAIGPSRPIEGRVLDIDTKAPLAGAVVRAVQVHGNNLLSSREREEFATRADAEGRYRIAGLPIGDGNQLVAFTTGADPYVAIGHEIDTSTGKESTTQDFLLKRGVWAEGRVFDAETQKPYTGEITYYFFLNPELKAAIPGVYRGFVDGGHYTNAKGEFRIPVLRAPGVLAYRYEGIAFDRGDIDRFPRGTGADQITAKAEPFGAFATAPHYLMPGNYERVVEIRPTADQPVVKADMPLIACPPINVRVVDAEGKPVQRFILEGASERWGWQRMTAADVTVTDLKPNEKRKLFAFDRDHNLAGFATVTYGEKETVLITLQKAGSVTGTIVDGDKSPRTDITLIPNLEKFRGQGETGIWAPVLNQSIQPTNVAVDKQGRFRLDGLVPGLKYNAHAHVTRMMNGQMQGIIIGAALTDVSVAPGEVKDLGLIIVGEHDDASTESKLKPPAADATVIDPPAVESHETKKVSSEPATPATPPPPNGQNAKPLPTDFTLNYRGQVVGPQNQPIAGAKIFRVFWRHSGESSDSIQPDAVTGADGKFEFNLKSSELDNEGLSGQLIAAAPGFGVALGSSLDCETTGEALARLPETTQRYVRERQAKERSAVFRLVADDTPITGQVVTTEGKPIAGARVRIKDLWISKNDNLDDFEKAAKQQKADFYSLRNQASTGVNGPQLPSVIPDAVTDTEGRFKLTGVGRERVVELKISGANIETMLVRARTRAGEKIVVPHQWRPGRADMPNETFLPSGFIHVAGPSQPVSGRIVDADTERPIGNLLVSAGQWGTFFSSGKPHLATRTDADGRYRLEGLPLEKEETIHVLPGADSPYLPVASKVTLTLDSSPAETNFRLKRGVLLRGQAVDKRTGQPIVGHVDYYAFDGNPNLQLYAGFARGMAHERRTDSQGRFEIPVMPGKGLLSFMADDHLKYRRGVGLETVDGPTDQNDPSLKVFRTVPMRVVSSNKHLLRGLDIAADAAKLDDLKLELESGLEVAGKVYDPDHKPLVGVIGSGPIFGGGWHEVNGDTVTVQGYYPDAAPRDLFFYHPGRNLAGYYQLKGEVNPPIQIVLQPAGGARGRIVDKDGSPVANVQLTGAGVPAGNFGENSLKLSTDKEGRFEIRGLLPGRKYTVIGSSGLERNRVGEDITVIAGETRDLGDVKLLPLDLAMSVSPAAAKTGAKENTVAAKRKADDAQEAPAKPEVGQRTIRGRIVDAQDKPFAGATVAAIATHIERVKGGSISPKGVVLAETKSDGDGAFTVSFAPIDSKTHRNANIIARAEGLGLAWSKIDFDPPPADKPTSDVVIRLIPEETIRCRLVDIDGQPCAGVRCNLGVLVPRSKGASLFAEEKAIAFKSEVTPHAWIPSPTSDNEGRVVFHGIPQGYGAYLSIAGDERVAPQDISLNTGAAEQRQERDATYRPLVKNATAGEELVLTLAPAQWFEGVVRYEDTGEPAPRARLSIWASQQQFGSMSSVEGVADENGKYRINPHPGIRFGVTAFPPAGAPYLTRATPLSDAIRWEDGDRKKQIDMTLKRGVLMRGKIVDAGTGVPVSTCSIQYIPERSNNPHATDDVVTGWQGIQTANEQGEFEIVVPPGLGRLLVHDADGRHVLQEIGSEELRRAKPGGQRNFAHAIHKLDVSVDKEPEPITIALQPGVTVHGRMVDAQGALVREALIISPLNIRAFWLTWHGHTEPTLGGNFEITGVGPDQEHLFYFLDAKRRLGAARTIRATDDPLDVVLEQCGEATARYVDPEGKPIKGHHPSLQLVLKPGVQPYDFEAQKNGGLGAMQDSIMNIDRTNYSMGPADTGTNAEGKITFPALIPGATYQFMEIKDGRAVAGREFKVTAGQKLDLGDITHEKPER